MIRMTERYTATPISLEVDEDGACSVTLIIYFITAR